MKKGKVVLLILILIVVLAGLMIFAKLFGSSAKERSLAEVETPSYVLDENGEVETDPDTKKPYIVETNIVGNLQTTVHAGRGFGDIIETEGQETPFNPEEETFPAMTLDDPGYEVTEFPDEPDEMPEVTEGRDVIGGGTLVTGDGSN